MSGNVQTAQGYSEMESDISTVHMVNHMISDKVHSMFQSCFNSFGLSMHLILVCIVVDQKTLLGTTEDAR